MIKNMSIQHRLYVGFSIIMGILLVLLAVLANNFVKLNRANQLDRLTMDVIAVINRMERDALEIQAAYSGFLLTGNERYIADLSTLEKSFFDQSKKGQALTGIPVQEARLQRLDAKFMDWSNRVIRPLIDKRRQLGSATGAADRIALDPLVDEGFKSVSLIREVFDELGGEESKLTAERAQHAEAFQQSMWIALFAGGTLSLLIAMVIAYLLSRSIIKPLDNIVSTIKELGASNQSARATVFSQDELGQVALEVNRMAQAIQDNLVRERDLSDALKKKIDALLESVAIVAAGDLTAKVTVTGNDSIGKMSAGLTTMFENLRELVSKIQRAGISVTTSSTEIAASSREQEATAVEQAQTSVEVLSTTKEIAANSVQLLDTIQEASQVVEYTTTATVDAQVSLRRMDQTMQHMVSATDSINAKLAALSEKAGNINTVLATISKVADQTNILSLNAAIEAEKAGEAGRGFSVVATEIRRLADQTAVATWDIDQMLKEMQSAVSASVMGMDKFSEEIRRSVDEARTVGNQLTAVIEQVQKLPPHFKAVFEGMQSQSIGASQITDTMRQLNDGSQQTVDSLRATSEAVQQLQLAAQTLQASVANFSINA